MPLIRPFRGLRPRKEFAQKVAAPPYDVLDTVQARERAKGNPYSILHVTKPEIDLDPLTDPYDPAVYAKGAENLAWLRETGVLQQDQRPCFYAYKQIMGKHEQLGLVACTSVDAYLNGIIKKHENTQPDKVNDRAQLMLALNAQTGPVFQCYREQANIAALLELGTKSDPVYDFIADHGVRHTFHVIEDDKLILQIQQSFEQIKELYIADGHHRSEAAAQVCRQMRKQRPQFNGEEEFNYVFSVIFPDTQMLILPYNRAVRGLNGLDVRSFLHELSNRLTVDPLDGDLFSPSKHHVLGMYLAGKWYSLRADAESPNPIDQLDVSILQKEVLEPLLGIADPRTDKRVKFIGGVGSVIELKRLVDTGDFQVAFSLFPTEIRQVMQVADAGQVMPPKSTWFEPKLLSGLVMHLLEDD